VSSTGSSEVSARDGGGVVEDSGGVVRSTSTGVALMEAVEWPACTIVTVMISSFCNEKKNKKYVKSFNL